MPEKFIHILWKKLREYSYLWYMMFEAGKRVLRSNDPISCRLPHYLVLTNVAVKSSEVVNELPLTVKFISQP